MRATNWRRTTDHFNELAKATLMSKQTDSEFRDCECSKHLRIHNFLLMVSNGADDY